MKMTLEFLEETIRIAGKEALNWAKRLGDLKIHHKGEKDLVSEADIAVEHCIRQNMRKYFPDFGFYGEEGGEQIGKNGRWIVDPIDGTLSFTKGQYHWSISIAVELEYELRMGAVYAPAMDTLYIAEAGAGALKNGTPIHVSDVDTLEKAVVASGFACLRSNLEENNLPRFGRIASRLSGIRVLGSAAIDCCFVADGRLDGFWEQNLNLYDIAAGMVIAREAGAVVTDFSGNPWQNPDQILISNPRLHPQLVELM
ncbi:MAG: inositol monophosphatase [SAR324 cluster bacterium]|nr:inositol monophosphatase [SAR324 cluster bacterium]